MKVNDVKTAELYKAYTTNASDQTSLKGATARNPHNGSSAVQDKVDISSKVQQMQTIDKAVEASPDIRPDKIAAAEQKIKNGSYQADYALIADKLLSSDISARI